MRKKAIPLIVLILLAVTSCTGELVFSSLANTRLQLIVKGTYETNDPADWLGNFFNDDGYDAAVTDLTGSEFHSQTQAQTPANLKWYIDLAEIRLARGNGRPSGRDPEDYWQFISQDRVLLCSQYNALQNRTLKNCREQNGREKLNQFFREGFEMKAYDIRAGRYNHLAMYFRKVIVTPAAFFNTLSGEKITDATATFENRGVIGYDIEERFQVKVGGSSVPLMFPLEKKNLVLDIPNDEEPFVLETRVFFKNNMMRHVVRTSTTLGSFVYFIAPSDHAINHQYDSLVEAGRLGGNIALAARIYKPSQSGSVDVSGITVAGGNTINYIAAIPAGLTFDPSTSLAYAATKANGAGVIKNLPAGEYNIIGLCDKKRRETGDVLQNGEDGYPETASPACAIVNITAGATSNAGIATCSCP